MARILVEDDEDHIRKYYSEELRDEGHEVFTTGSGHELLRRIDLLSPEAVILDIRLPDYDGLDLLQEIRARHHDLCRLSSVAPTRPIEKFRGPLRPITT